MGTECSAAEGNVLKLVRSSGFRLPMERRTKTKQRKGGRKETEKRKEPQTVHNKSAAQ